MKASKTLQRQMIYYTTDEGLDILINLRSDVAAVGQRRRGFVVQS